jgi:hypothetical protein
MKLKQLPIVCMPLELPDEAAMNVLIFLREMTSAFAQHYAHQINRYCDQHRQPRPPTRCRIDDSDIPF